MGSIIDMIGLSNSVCVIGGGGGDSTCALSVLLVVGITGLGVLRTLKPLSLIVME